MHWWHRSKRDLDLERELRSDLELEEEEHRGNGLSSEDARYAAMRAFGNPTLIREQTRAVWSWNRVELLLRDFKISVRTLSRSPGFSLTAVLVMALCIGTATSLFTVARSVLLRPLPFDDHGKLVMLYEHFRAPSMNAQGFNYNLVAPADYYDWRAQSHGFADLAALRWWQFSLTGGDGKLPEIVQGRGASWNLFPLLGVQAAVGRTFTQSEDRPDGFVTMITWSLFERRFGGDPSIVGKQIHLDGETYTVVGVLPKWFNWPDAKVEIWVPYASGLPPAVLQHHDFHFTNVVARLKPDVTLDAAMSQIATVQYSLHQQNLNAPVAEDVASRTLTNDVAHGVQKPLMILLGAAVCMLLIGCLNVANLMVARSTVRQREIAVRCALGAQRGALIRVQLIESFLLSLTGGAIGVLLSLAITKWLVSSWHELPSAQSIHADGVVLAFACSVVIAAALLSGLLPAILSTGKTVMAALHASSRSAAGSQSRTILRKTLLTVEIAMTVVLLIAAGLLLKSFWRLRATDLGCTTDRVLTMSYSLPGKQYDTPAKVNAFNEELLTRVQALPGVRGAGLGSAIPGGGAGEDDAFTILGHPSSTPGAAEHDALYRTASPGYFATLQVPLLRGRLFTGEDRNGHPNTCIVSHQLAQQFFSAENPLGAHLVVSARKVECEIVGVVGDTLYQIGKASQPTIYLPILNGESNQQNTLAVRAATDPLSLSLPIQKEIAKLNPQLPVSDVFTMQQIVAQSLGSATLSASLVLAFALLSLLLALVGLFGVLSYVTTQRAGEIGLRLALGARREQVVRLMLSDGLRPTVYGLVLGLAASLGAVRLVQSMLYATQPLDLAVFAGVAATLIVAATLACLLPAWRASRVDPVGALRME